MEYYFEETPTTFWQFLNCWESAMGVPAPPELFCFLSPDFIFEHVEQIMPQAGLALEQ